MMRAFVILSAVLALLLATSEALPKPWQRVPHAKPQPYSTTMTTALLETRGGDLGPLSRDTLATTFCALCSLDAIAGAVIPRTSMKWFGVNIVQGSLSHTYLHGIGASAASLAVSTYLAVSGMVSLEHALAYGFAARLVSMTAMILAQEETKVGMTVTQFGTMWVVLAGTIAALVHGNFEALPWAKVVSLVLAFHGMFLFLKPEVFLRKTAISIGPDPLEKDMATIDGGYMAVSALATFLLASGVDPVQVTGYAALSFVPVLYQIMEIITVETFGGVPTGILLMAVMAVLAGIVVGTLH